MILNTPRVNSFRSFAYYAKLASLLVFPTCVVAQTPASGVHINPNQPDVEGMFVEVLTEMQQPTPSQAIGAPNDLNDPQRSSVLPMLDLPSQAESTTQNTDLPSIAPQQNVNSYTGENAGGEPNGVDPSGLQAQPSQTLSGTNSPTIYQPAHSLDEANNVIASLQAENAQLQERVNSLNKQMVLLRQSFQQANSALLQRIHELQSDQRQQGGGASTVGNQENSQLNESPAPAQPTLSATVPSLSETAAPTAEQVGTASTTLETQLNSEPDLESATVTAPSVPSVSSSTTQEPSSAEASPSSPAAPTSSVSEVSTGAEQTPISASPADQLGGVANQPSSEQASAVPQTSEMPNQDMSLAPSAMPVQSWENQSPQSEPYVLPKQNLPAEQEPAKQPVLQSKQPLHMAQTSNGGLSASSPEVSVKGETEVTQPQPQSQTSVENLKSKALTFLNDPGFMLKVGIGLAIFGFFWLILAFLPKKTKKAETFPQDDEPLTWQETEEQIEPSSPNWGEGYGETEPMTGGSLASDAENLYVLEEGSSYEEPVLHETDKAYDDQSEPEHAYQYDDQNIGTSPDLSEHYSENTDMNEASLFGKGETIQNTHENEEESKESFSIANEELDPEDMLVNQPHASESTQGYDFSDQVEDTENVSIKLDLVRAYLEMRDFDTAEEVLHSVLHHGSSEQQQDAQNLLEELNAARSE